MSREREVNIKEVIDGFWVLIDCFKSHPILTSVSLIALILFFVLFIKILMKATGKKLTDLNLRR